MKSLTSIWLRHLPRYLALSAVGLILTVVAATVAAATGSHVNGDGISSFTLLVGALAGLTAAAIYVLLGLIPIANTVMLCVPAVFVYLASTFGLAVLITAQVTGQATGTVPPQLLRASAVAILPMMLRGFTLCGCSFRAQFSFASVVVLDSLLVVLRDDSPTDEEWVATLSERARELRCLSKFRLFTAYVGGLGIHALCGFAFASMAKREGMEVCSANAAAAAGAAYAAIAGIALAVNDVVWSKSRWDESQ